MPRETDEDQFYQTTIAPLAHCVISAVAKPKETDEDQFYHTTTGPLAHCNLAIVIHKR